MIESNIEGVTLKLQTGKTPPSKEEKYFNGDINWYTPTDLKTKLLGRSKRTITELAHTDKKALIYPRGTVLLSCIGDIGKLGITTDDKSSSNQQITGLIPDTTKITSEYLYYWCLAHKYVFESKGTSVTVPMLNNKRLRKIKISYSESIDDQIKIANLLSQVEALIAKREESINLLDELLRSTFLDMFGDPINNPKNFEEVQLQDICLEKGEYGSGASAIDYDKSLPRYLRITDINNDGTLSKEKKSPDKIEEKYYLEYGDILFARTGATVGKTYLHTSDEVLQFAGYLIRFKPNFELINPYYLFYYTLSGYYNYWVFKKQRAAGQPNINAKEYGSLKLLKPPKPLQDKFATIVQQVEESKKRYQDSLNQLHQLFGSLSQRAFKGELDLEEIGTQKKEDYSAADRLNSIEDEFKIKMDSLLGDDSLTDRPDLEEKALSVVLGNKFGFSDQSSIELIEKYLTSDAFMEQDAGEADALKYIVKNHDNPISLIEALLKLILEKEQEMSVRQEASLLLSEYPLLDENILTQIDKIIDDKNIEQEIRLIVAEAFSSKIGLYPTLKNNIYKVLREDNISPVSNREIFVHFLENEIKTSQDNLAFDTLLKVIASDIRRATAYKMLFFSLMGRENEIKDDIIDSYDYTKLKSDVFHLLDNKKVKQTFNEDEKEIVLSWVST